MFDFDDHMNHWRRLYETFGDESGARLVLDVIRATCPEIPDLILARLVRMDAGRFAGYLGADRDMLGGDPNEDVLRGLVRATSLLGTPEDVQTKMTHMKYVAQAAWKNLLQMHRLFASRVTTPPYFRDREYEYSLVADSFPEFDRREDVMLLHGIDDAIRSYAEATAGLLRDFPKLARMAGSLQELTRAMDAVAYMADRAWFDDLMIRAMHMRLDGKRDDDPAMAAFLSSLNMAMAKPQGNNRNRPAPGMPTAEAVPIPSPGIETQGAPCFAMVAPADEPDVPAPYETGHVPGFVDPPFVPSDPGPENSRP